MKVWKQLRKLRKKKNRIVDAGICDSVRPYLTSIEARSAWGKNYNAAVTSWPLYSGHVGYPVPSPAGKIHPQLKYWNASYMWKGPYGKLRKNLLEHMIQFYKERNL